MPYIPHTKSDIKSMLSEIGIKKIKELFKEIPSFLFSNNFKNIPKKINEINMLKIANKLAKKNKKGICFIGAGSYDHFIPSIVWDITSRSEFLTAYTPYQPEASQGTLQILYEYQSMISELTKMEISNSSMYDGSTALAEAIFMAIRIKNSNNINKTINEKKTILIPNSLHPLYKYTLKTILNNHKNINIIYIPFNQQTGTTDLSKLNKYKNKNTAAIIITQPNFFGCLEPVDELTYWANKNNIISIACVNPLSLLILTPPGIWGGDGVTITCGEGQPLGCPMFYGGPYFGFFGTKMKYVRQMPGRIVGKTTDKNGKTGFTLVLQTREQHIRREKATSNICTNQNLLAIAATIYLSVLGSKRLNNIAIECHEKTKNLIQKLVQIKGIKLFFNKTPFFHEALIEIKHKHYTAEKILLNLEKYEIFGGYQVEQHYPNLKNCILTCATEMRTKTEIQYFYKTLKNIILSKN
ncbi:aminomethyl-transferring glycine dehydrogenase subunit GcvPA [Candidatus Legionella polyplacis]|uniref:Probable glycine dehydrogenase (decarboxylating) subunit 1 n=1 Tax=Candidatus Legionella polyplacis TaxID=2005262 RepID=A0ABZ2GW88_9GAMM